MAGKSTRPEVVTTADWAAALGAMSLVLLWTAEPGAFQYWARVGAVAVGWCIFFLCFTPLRRFRDVTVITAKADAAIILLILTAFFVIAATALVNALVQKQVGTALLFGLVALGIFNVIREMAGRSAGGKKGAPKAGKKQGAVPMAGSEKENPVSGRAG